MPEEKVQVSVDLQQKDLLQAQYWYVWSRKSTWIIPIMCLPLWGFVVWQQKFGFISAALLFLVGCLFPLLVNFPATYFTVRARYAQLQDVHKNVHYIFSPDGIDAIAGESFSHTDWKNILRIVEIKNSFNLYITKDIFIVIPKRCFLNDTEIILFRDIAFASLGEKAQLDHPIPLQQLT